MCLATLFLEVPGPRNHNAETCNYKDTQKRGFKGLKGFEELEEEGLKGKLALPSAHAEASPFRSINLNPCLAQWHCWL